MKLLGLFIFITAGVSLAVYFGNSSKAEVFSEVNGTERVEALNWSTNFEESLAEAKESGKFMLLFFTGSDWCPPCIALDREVLSKKPFHDFAKEHLILVKVDEPEGYILEEAVRLQNERLNVIYRVFFSYPTVLLTDSEGMEIARTSYRMGGANRYVRHLKSLLGLK